MPLYKQKVKDEPAKVSICLDFSSLILMDSLPPPPVFLMAKDFDLLSPSSAAQWREVLKNY